MPSSPLRVVVQQLRAAGRGGAGRTDGELRTRFLSRRDEDALAALVERHAPMVWGVYCRVLRNPHAAEDAFQATFLVLVQKAATVVPGEMVANWLYGVAQQTAVRLRALAAKRGRREVQMNETPEPAVAEARNEELLALLDQELSRLPERFRALIVMCDLEGHTRKDVARQLGCPEGTVASGLARARALLAKRLTQRGVVITGSVAVLSAGLASASAPPALVASTIKVASLLAAGQVAGIVTAKVAALTEGVVKAMLVTKIKSVLAVVLVIGLALGGIGLGVGLSTNPVAVARTEPPKQPPAKEESPTPPVATKKDEKPSHIVEKTDMKGRMPSGLPSGATEDGAVVVKSFFAKMPTYPDIRFREFFDPRYLKKHGRTDRDIAFEIANHQGIASLHVADDNLTVLVVLEVVRRGKGSVRHAVRGLRRPHLHLAGESPRPENRHLQALDSAGASEITLRRADCEVSTVSSVSTSGSACSARSHPLPPAANARRKASNRPRLL